ncbi:MAG: ABC transporter substrate-binding protein [Sulfurospirillaceae bacterium]|nr:ABC transporter substrate-binding protein [Sulfurospirillaceae bacterium]
MKKFFLKQFKLLLIATTGLMLSSVSVIAADNIKVGAIFDLSGGLNIYGIQQSRALHLAVDNINNNGGVNGKKIKVIEYDSQSSLSKYTQFTNTLIRKDRIVALFAGLTSSSREAIRPIIRKAKIPYFYSSLYEGGACDKYTFVTGASASQEMKPLIKWAVKKYGKRIFIMGPDYNFGTISGHWIKKYAKDFGAEVVGEDYLPLTASNFSPTIQKIQESKPSFVVALAVGSNQISFYEQFSAAGLKGKIGLVSTNYGSGNQQVVVSPQAGDGIVTSQNYFDVIDEPANKIFKAAWIKKYGYKEPITSGAVDVWLSVNLWAKAAQKAKSSSPKSVVSALESGLTFEGPNGLVKMLPRSHHLQQNIYLAEGNNKHQFKVIATFKSVTPDFEEQVCNLIKHPKTAKLFVP